MGRGSNQDGLFGQGASLREGQGGSYGSWTNVRGQDEVVASLRNCELPRGGRESVPTGNAQKKNTPLCSVNYHPVREREDPRSSR